MASRSKLNLNLGKRKAMMDPSLKEKFDQVMERHGILIINGVDTKAGRDDMEDMGEIGFGTCGHVYKMRHKPSGTLMAVKQMPRNNNEEEIKRIAMDLDVVLKSRDCPYIVHCLGCFIFDAEVWICMELMSTCFDRLLRITKKPIPERILGKVTVATVEALSYLKDNHNVIHRDVKPSNILLDERGNVKLCDFGISGRLVDSKAKTRSAGCAAYMAPERIEPHRKQYDIRADVWSLGITLLELATGQLPYHDCQTDFEVLTKVIECDAPRLPPNCFSDRFYEFVEKCLTKDCLLRPKYKELLELDFIRYYKETPVDVGGWYRALKLHELFKDALVATQTTTPTPPAPPISNGHSAHEVTDAAAPLQLHPTNPFALSLNMERLSLDSKKESNSPEIMTPPPRRSLSQSSPGVPPTPRRSLTQSPQATPPPRRSLTNSPMRTPTPNRNGGTPLLGGLNRCFCDLKSIVEPLRDNTSPITLKRFQHQRKQSMDAGEIHCLKCNNTRKVSSANAAIPTQTSTTTSYSTSTYLNGVSSPRRDYRFPTSHVLLSEDSLRQYRSTDAYLNSSCDTSSSSSSNLSSGNVQNLSRFWNNAAGASPRLNGNGNRFEVVQFTSSHYNSTTTTSLSPLSSPPPPLYPRARRDSSTTTPSPSPDTPPFSSRVRSPPLSLPPRTRTPPETSQPVTTRMSTVSRMTSFFSFNPFRRNNKD